jgi:hypothetical protein
MKKQLIAELTNLYKKSLNSSSKFYTQDVADFKKRAETKTEAQLRQQLANMKCIMGMDSKVNKIVNTEVKRMDKAGMFKVGNMKPVNALD